MRQDMPLPRNDNRTPTRVTQEALTFMVWWNVFNTVVGCAALIAVLILLFIGE
jgi:hypothetical protein